MELDDILEFAQKNNVPILRDESRTILCSVVRKEQPNRILEFGTAVGFSAILMLSSCEVAEIDTIELDAERANMAKINIAKLGFRKRANIINGDALSESEKLIDCGKTYDLIFLDSAKGQYIKLLPNILKLLKSGGTLVADNVLFRGYVEAKEFPKRFKTIVVRLREFIDYCKNSEEFTDVQILKVEDGILIAKKK